VAASDYRRKENIVLIEDAVEKVKALKTSRFNFKHVPDETNVILRYAPTKNITQDGVLYPKYLSEEAKQQAGNTIKSLKSQNLIS
jgi:phage terminase small subunit